MRRERRHRVGAVARALALAGAAVLLLAAPARAQDREYVLRWQAADANADGYRVHLGPASGQYDENLDLGFVPEDPDGISRATLTLDAARGYHIAMTAYAGTEESDLSNEIFVEPSACDPLACDDGDPCTADDCNAGGCVHTPVPDGTMCGAGAVCLAATCQVAECFADADCANGDVCDGAEVCADFFCMSGPAPMCPAPGPCQTATCDPTRGCTTEALPDGTRCDDGVAETLGDQCTAGVCAGVRPECTSDEECDDGNVCNGNETCDPGGSCRPGPAPLCGPATQCADPVCDPVAGCRMTTRADGTSCDDNDAGTQGDVCTAGVCAGTPFQPECVADADCADGDVCNGLESCVGGQCVRGMAPTCRAPDACNDVRCDPVAGCMSVPRADGTRCDDGDPQTQGDQCRSGTCAGVAPAPGPTAIRIDVAPRRRDGRLSLARDRLIGIRLFGAPDFDVSQIDTGSLRFGPDGAPVVKNRRSYVRDRDHDGYPDVYAIFHVEGSGLTTAHTQACVEGVTHAGERFRGCDAVRVVPR